MPSIELATAAPAAAVWEVLVDLRAWPEWGPTVAGAELDGPGPLALGSRGKVWTPVGVPLPFEIDEFIDGRAWGWRVAGVSATRHEVIPTRGGCVLSFGVPVWAPAYLPVMAVALPRIARLATARRST
ncbi:SRPBCC family protein [Williamsia soli]|uniref:SRPBCC family protein n=1 Tax=Williamsia soli TaxID=364929 RepID=UPI00355673E9